MKSDMTWKRTERWKASSGFGLPVERNGQIGYAKQDYIDEERLAACLAGLVGAPVAHIEIAYVEGVGRSAVSFVKNEYSRPLDDPHVQRSYSEQERQALERASGLIPFLAWVDAVDHASGANYVLEYDGADASPSIVAIDFEDAFAWKSGEDEIKSSTPAGLREAASVLHIEEMLARIERLSEAQIEQCCLAASRPDLAPILIRRARLLREEMRRNGW